MRKSHVESVRTLEVGKSFSMPSPFPKLSAEPTAVRIVSRTEESSTKTTITKLSLSWYSCHYSTLRVRDGVAGIHVETDK